MKKTIKVIAASAAVCALLSACSKDTLNVSNKANDELIAEEDAGNGDYTITFTGEIVDPENAQEDVKTVYHDKTIWWKAGDKVRFFQIYKKEKGAENWTPGYIDRTISGDSDTYSITYTFTPPAEFPAYYCSLYPSGIDGNIKSDDDGVPCRILLTLPYEQKPLANSFDPAADILASEFITSDTKKTEFQLKYMRRVALGKMTITNLIGTGSYIKSVTFQPLSENKYLTKVAGAWRFDLKTNETIAHVKADTDYSIIMNYTEDQAMASGMTAHFTCWPFELKDGDSFKVIVETYDGLKYEKRVILNDRDLKLVEGRATQFTVNMKDADLTSPIILGKYTTGTNIPTINSFKCKISSAATNLSSIKFCAVLKADYYLISNLNDYIDENGTAASSSTISGINGGTTYNLSFNNLSIDTEYAILVKGVDTDGKIFITKISERTDWFKLGLVTRSSGDLQSQFYGVGLDATKTKNFRIVATSTLEGIDPETYYTSTLNPGTSLSLVSTINTKGAAGFFRHESEYYVDKTTTATVISGENYTIMMKVTNTRGETKFCTASANAK